MSANVSSRTVVGELTPTVVATATPPRRRQAAQPVLRRTGARPDERRSSTESLRALQPACSARVERFDLRPFEPGHVRLDVVADLRLEVREMAVALGEAREQAGVERQPQRTDRPGRAGPSRRSAVAARGPSGRHAARRSRRSARCTRRRRRHRAPRRAARSSSWSGSRRARPTTSIELPPRKCRMRTPRAQPCLLASMKPSALPWNQVAIMRPSSCQTVRRRSQSPASRQSAQDSTSSRISRRDSSRLP